MRNKHRTIDSLLKNGTITSLISIILLMFSFDIVNHNKDLSWLFTIIDITLLIAISYLTIKISVELIYSFNKIDMQNDLNCWGLRIVGIVIAIAGIFGTFTFCSLFVMSNSIIILFMIIGVGCSLFVGGFAQFRSTRRYGTFMYFEKVRRF